MASPKITAFLNFREGQDHWQCCLQLKFDQTQRRHHRTKINTARGSSSCILNRLNDQVSKVICTMRFTEFGTL